MTERQMMFGGSVDNVVPQVPQFDAVAGNFNDVPGSSIYHQATPIAIVKNPQLITTYAVQAIQCFVKSIQLAEGKNMDVNKNL